MVILVNFNQHRLGTNAVNSPRHRRQRIGICQHLIACIHTADTQTKLNSLTTRGSRHTIFHPLINSIFLFQIGCLCLFACRHIISVKPARAQNFNSPLNPLFRDSFLLGKGFCELLYHICPPTYVAIRPSLECASAILQAGIYLNQPKA